MIVTLDARVFTQPETSQLELLSIIAMCFEGRHELLVDPLSPGDGPLRAWLDMLPTELRGEVEYALEWGPEAASRRTANAPRIRVANVPADDWKPTEPELTPSTALRLLRRPLKLLVENRRNDGAFLRKMMPLSYKQAFLEALDKGWVEIESGGGLGELKKRVESAWSGKDMLECGRIWVMFDSDARQANRPSNEAREFLGYCKQEVRLPWPLEANMLERRSIENYLPVKSLQGWASFGGPAESMERRHKVDSLRLLSAEQRAHYNMKSGLLGDLPAEKRKAYRNKPAPIADPDLSPPFQGLSREVKQHLHEGFGDGICDLFHDKDGTEWVAEAHLQLEVPASERMSLSQSIIDRM